MKLNHYKMKNEAEQTSGRTSWTKNKHNLLAIQEKKKEAVKCAEHTQALRLSHVAHLAL